MQVYKTNNTNFNSKPMQSQCLLSNLRNVNYLSEITRNQSQKSRPLNFQLTGTGTVETLLTYT